MKIILACLIAALTLVHAPARAAASPLTLQTCTSAPTSTTPGSVAGCAPGNFLFAAVSANTLVRTSTGGFQSWKAFGTLASTDEVYGSDYAWHLLGSITPALQPTSPVPPPVGTPPACPPVPDRYVPMQWTCSVANGVATCTAPITP